MSKPFIFSKEQLERVEAGLEKIQLAFGGGLLSIFAIDWDAIRAAVLVFNYLKEEGREEAGRELARLIIEGHINVMVPPSKEETKYPLYDYFKKKIDAISTDEERYNVTYELTSLIPAGKKIEILDEKFNVHLGTYSALGYSAYNWTPKQVGILYESIFKQAQQVSIAYLEENPSLATDQDNPVSTYGKIWRALIDKPTSAENVDKGCKDNKLYYGKGLHFIMTSPKKSFSAIRSCNAIHFTSKGLLKWGGYLIYSSELVAHETGHFISDIMDGKLERWGHPTTLRDALKEAKDSNKTIEVDADGNTVERKARWGDILADFPQGSPNSHLDPKRHWSIGTDTSDDYDIHEFIAELWAAWTMGYIDYSINPEYAHAAVRVLKDHVRTAINRNLGLEEG